MGRNELCPAAQDGSTSTATARSPEVNERRGGQRAVAGCSGGVVRCAGQVLITQRPAGKFLAGYWEFPGGKLDPNESAEQALGRELREELGINYAAVIGCWNAASLRRSRSASRGVRG